MNTAMVLLASLFTKEKFMELGDIILKWFLGAGKNILIALVVLFVGNKLVKWVIKLIGKATEKSKIEPIVAKFLISLIKFVLYAVVAIVVVGILGIPASSFIAILSTAGLTIGLALQGSLSNFAGGILILLFKPFRIGDYIKEDGHGNEGTVYGIDLLYTKIQTVDNKIVIVPNGVLANTSITNYTVEKKRRVDLLFGISYEANIKLAKDTSNNVADKEEGIIKGEPVTIYVSALEESQVTIGLRVWTKTEDYWDVRWRMIENVKLALDEAGIEIPFNQLSVTLKQN